MGRTTEQPFRSTHHLQHQLSYFREVLGFWAAQMNAEPAILGILAVPALAVPAFNIHFPPNNLVM